MTAQRKCQISANKSCLLADSFWEELLYKNFVERKHCRSYLELCQLNINSVIKGRQAGSFIWLMTFLWYRFDSFTNIFNAGFCFTICKSYQIRTTWICIVLLLKLKAVSFLWKIFRFITSQNVLGPWNSWWNIGAVVFKPRRDRCVADSTDLTCITTNERIPGLKLKNYTVQLIPFLYVSPTRGGFRVVTRVFYGCDFCALMLLMSIQRYMVLNIYIKKLYFIPKSEKCRN